MATVIFLMILLSVDFCTASTARERISSAIFNITKGGLDTVLRPLATTLSRTEDTFKGILRSDDGKSSANILGNTEGGGSLDFFGRIVSSIRPYLLPLRVISSKSSGNATSMVWSTSKEE